MATNKDYAILDSTKTRIAESSRLSSVQKCTVEEREGGAVVHFRIDPQEWVRLKRRMATQDPAMFLWENHIHRMIDGAVY